MTWTCEQTEARLSDYFDGVLDAAEQQAFAAHLRDCAHCAPLAASVQGLIRGLRALPPIAEPPRLVYAILDSTLGPRESAGQILQRWLRGIASVRFAYGAATVVATCAVLLTATGFNWKHPRFADLAPANLYRAADRQAHVIYARSAKFVGDLRVVYEIQSRLSDNEQVPPERAPESKPSKQPGMSDGPRNSLPKQQNRANGIHPEMVFAAILSDRSAR